MKVTTRPASAEVFPLFYLLDASGFAAALNGMVDNKTGRLWLNTVDGVQEAPYNTWVLRDDEGLHFLTQDEVLARYVPEDWAEGKSVLGSQSWPGDPRPVLEQTRTFAARNEAIAKRNRANKVACARG